MTVGTPDVLTLLAEQEVWHLDPWHTSIQFALRNRGAGRVRGRFKRPSGTVAAGVTPTGVTVRVVVDMNSFSTGIRGRDADIIGPRFFNVAAYPTARFGADLFTRTSFDTGVLTGNPDHPGHHQRGGA
jgi:polyisoprenoid-binding protein YceI